MPVRSAYAVPTASSGIAVVAFTAAVISFSHVRAVAADAGESELAAWLLPISIDGAVAAAVAVLFADSRAGRRPSPYTWVLLGLGLAASLAANVASAEPTVTARLVAAWPPVALALGIEVLAGMLRVDRGQQSVPARQRVVVPDGQPARPRSNGRPSQSTTSVKASRSTSRHDNGHDSAARSAGAPTDYEAIRIIQQLDDESPTGEATRLEIQRRLGCGGSRAARLARLARRQPGSSLASWAPSEA